MAFDEELAERVRALITVRDGVLERRMFGGIAWMLHGNMACGVSGDELIVRLEREDVEQALEEPGTRRFQPVGKPMAGFLLIAPEVTADDAELARWVDCGADFASSLPPK